MSNSLQPHELQDARLPCLSPTPRACSNSYPSSRWRHPTISFSVISCCLHSFPASRSFPVSQLFASGGQSIGASVSVLSMVNFRGELTNRYSVQFSSVTQSFPTLCNPMYWSMPGFPVYHQLPELTQTHVHRVSDAIQPSNTLSSPSPPVFHLSQHQGLFK